MDDSRFDQKTAEEWIRSIEKGESPRDLDIYPRLSQWIEQISPCEVLEIGSGQGICSSKIKKKDLRYTGIDPSTFLIERAKKLYLSENRQFLIGSAYKIPVEDFFYDAAFSIAVWHLLSNLQKAGSELSRVLKNDGHFLIITANPGAYEAWSGLYTDIKRDGNRFEGKMKSLDASSTSDVLYFHSLDEIQSSLSLAGLETQKIETFRNDFYISIQGQKKHTYNRQVLPIQV